MKYLKIFVVFFILSLFHQKAYSQIEVEADYIILQDHLSGEILYAKNSDAKIYPASMTKIMTVIVAFELLKNDELSLNDKFIVSENYLSFDEQRWLRSYRNYRGVYGNDMAFTESEKSKVFV